MLDDRGQQKEWKMIGMSVISERLQRQSYGRVTLVNECGGRSVSLHSKRRPLRIQLLGFPSSYDVLRCLLYY